VTVSLASELVRTCAVSRSCNSKAPLGRWYRRAPHPYLDRLEMAVAIMLRIACWGRRHLRIVVRRMSATLASGGRQGMGFLCPSIIRCRVAPRWCATPLRSFLYRSGGERLPGCVRRLSPFNTAPDFSVHFLPRREFCPASNVVGWPATLNPAPTNTCHTLSSQTS